MPGKNRPSVRFGLKVGILSGILLATVLSLIALALWALPGESDADRLGVGIAWVAFSYYVTAGVGGSLLGMLWAATRGRIPGALLGFLAVLLFGSVLGTGELQRGSGSVAEVFGAAVLTAIVLGAPVGFLVERDLRRRDQGGS